MMILKRKNVYYIKKVLALLVCSVVVVMMMTSCGSQNTLEKSIADDPTAKADIESTETELSEEMGMDLKIEFQDNTMIYTYKYETTYSADAIDNMKGFIDEALESSSTMFEEVIAELEDEFDLSGVNIKIIYQNGDGSTIMEKVFE